MRGKLQPGFSGGAYHWAQAFRGNKEKAAVIRISNAVDFADAPRLAHVGAASEHPSIEVHLDANDSQERVSLLKQFLIRNLADLCLDSRQVSLSVDVVGKRHAYGG